MQLLHCQIDFSGIDVDVQRERVWVRGSMVLKWHNNMHVSLLLKGAGKGDAGFRVFKMYVERYIQEGRCGGHARITWTCT